MIGNRYDRNYLHFSLALLVCTSIVASAEDCRWTECQPDAAVTTSCDPYERTEKARVACDGGFKYQCCVTDGRAADEFLADQCWWSECRPDDREDRECPMHSVRSKTQACAGGGDRYQCCVKKSALIDYFDDFPGGVRNESVAERLYVASEKHRAPEPANDNPAAPADENSRSGRKKAGGGKPTAETIRSGATTDRGRAETGPSRGRAASTAEPSVNRTARRVDEGRARPIRADRRDPAPAAGDGRVVGYYTSWSPVEMVAGMLERLTHVVYAFLVTQEDGTVDFDAAASRERLERLTALAKSRPVRVMFAVGGATNSQYFSAIAASPDARGKFVASLVRLAGDNGLDGVDIDWEYPAVGGGAAEDVTNFVLLVKELREALDAHAAETGRTDRYLISFAGAAGQWALDPGFDLPGLLNYADFVNVMAYDYFGVWGTSSWSQYTGPPAPLFPGTPSGFPQDFSHSNVDWTIGYYIEKTNSPEKINMGVPFYGYYWNNVGDPIDANDQMWRTAQPVDGVYQGGTTPWRKIQEDHLSDDRFQQAFHDGCKTPYAWNEATRVFLGYENQESLNFKVNYATEKNLGGLMIWAVDQDDDNLTLMNSVHKAQLRNKTIDSNDVD